jgi:hypothetical protein
VHSYQLARITDAFVDYPCVDVEFHVIEKVAGHAPEADWSVSVNAWRLSRRPGVVEQRAVFQIMIRMIVCDENVPQPVKRDSRVDQLTRNAIAAIDDVRNIVDEQQRRRIAAVCSGGKRGSPFSSEQDDPRARSLCESARINAERKSEP